MFILIVGKTTDKKLLCIYVFFDLRLYGFSLKICFPETIS